MLSTLHKPAQVGDVIRSLDFPGSFDCYMIGLVTDIKDNILYCRAISRVWENKSERATGEFRTPQEGASTSDVRFPGRITVLI